MMLRSAEKSIIVSRVKRACHYSNIEQYLPKLCCSIDAPYPGVHDILNSKDTMIIGIPAVKRKTIRAKWR